MKEFGKDNFDRAIRAKFKDAAYVPSDTVWEGVETALLRAENGKIQKRAIWYRNLAASVILIALISIYFNVVGVFQFNEGVAQLRQIDVIGDEFSLNKLNKETGLMPPQLITGIAMASSDFDGQANASKQKSVVNIVVEGSNNKQSDRTERAVVLSSIEKVEGLNLSALARLSPNTDNRFVMDSEGLDKVSYFAISEAVNRSEKNDKMNFVADLSFGSGTFNPNASVTGNSVQPSAIVSNASGFAGRNAGEYNVEREAVQELSSAPMQSNLSLSYGLSFGMNLTNRLLLKSGLQYGNYRSTSESSAVVRDVNNDQLYPFHGASSTAKVAEGKVVNITSPYNLYNDFEILSVPIQFTYNVLNTRLGVGITAGITTDFLISNTLTGASDQINSIKFTQNDSKSYKDVFASSLVGLEFTYALGQHYGLSLSPQFKKALTDVTNANTNFKSSPAFASVNMSFQYIF